jgi:DNA repair protein RecO (recombination protein O)
MYSLRFEAGLVEAGVGAESTVSGAAFIALQTALRSRDLDALRAACAADEPALRRQLRQWLAYHLGGAPLRTREVMRDLQPLLSHR